MNKESGLLGISGLSSDLRVLEKPGVKVTNARNWQSEPLFTELPVSSAGHAASLRRLDGNHIHRGIGENWSLIRRLVMEHLADIRRRD
ncbi:hypothetical protein ACLK17_19145 [Escherichia coli]